MNTAFTPDPDSLDFHVIVSAVQGRADLGFVACVARAPVDRWGTPFLALPDTGALQKQLELDGITVPLDASGNLSARWRRDSNPMPAAAEAADTASPTNAGPNTLRFRYALFSTLFPSGSDVYVLLATSCERAKQEGKSLRMWLELPPELANLPWELMRCPQNHWKSQWVNQARTFVLRYLGEIATPVKEAQEAGRATVLLIRSDPQEFRDRRLTESFLNEWEKIKEIFRRQSGHLDLETIEGEDTYGQLLDSVLRLVHAKRRVVGVHFIGHGDCDENGGYLLGEGSGGTTRRLYESDLRDALDSADAVRWVFLNACTTGYTPVGCPLSGLATSLSIVKNVPTVIAYTRPVVSSDAEWFAPEFYKLVLDAGLGIEEAVRHLLHRLDDSGGLVILSRTVAGKMQTRISLPRRSEETVESPPPAVSPSIPVVSPPTLSSPQPGAARVPRALAGQTGEMVLVPSGPYRHGLTEQQIKNVLAQFKARGLAIDMSSAAKVLRQEKLEERSVDAFLIDLTPVTNAQFQAFVDATGWETEAERRKAPQTWRTHAHLTDHPVVFVSHDDAIEFCKWADKRLPTADEWLKACRGSNGSVYPWGDDFDPDKCNTAESQHGWETTPVHQFPGGRSPYGCYDMVGNVEEWTSTPTEDDRRIVLGGSWCMTCQVYGLSVLRRVASRKFYSNEQGFRCARNAGA